LAVLAALVSCAGIAYATSRYLRVRHDFYLRNAWRATILLSLGLILSVHAVTAGFDRWIGLPNTARWLENALIVCSGYYADLVHVAMVQGIAASRRQHRWIRVWLAAVVIALALLLWRAHLPELASFSLPTPNPWLIFYRLVWLSFLAFVIVRLILYNWRFGQITPDPVIRLTTLAMVLAGLFALGVIVTTMAEPLLPATSSVAYPLRVLLELCVLGMAISFIFSTLPTWNPRLGGPALARIIVSASAYSQLSTLWREVTAAAPEVVLPTAPSWGDVLRHPSDIDVLLQRRVVEILDGWRVLLGAEPAESKSRGAILPRLTGAQRTTSATFSGSMRGSTLGEQIVEAAHATEQRLRSMRAAAETDADRLLAALFAEAAPASNGNLTGRQKGIADSKALLSFQPQTYLEQVRYLEFVARAFDDRKPLRHRHKITGSWPMRP
jgi:uncharacterized protein DUF6545